MNEMGCDSLPRHDLQTCITQKKEEFWAKQIVLVAF
jgi:hypothetical protein